MKDTFNVQYTTLSQEIEQLKSFLQVEVIEESKKQYEAINNYVDEMYGLTSRTLNQSVSMHQEKAMYMAKALEKILEFMENSSHELQKREQELAVQMDVGKGEIV